MQVPFGGSSYLTLQVRLDHDGSVVKSEFVILKEGESLHSGKYLISYVER